MHDMGGMHGLGPIEAELGEPVFHADWEKRVLALSLTTGAGRWNIDAGRHAIERIPGPTYLRMSYYEKWFTRIGMLAVERGLLTLRELETGRPEGETLTPALPADRVAAVLASGGPTSRTVEAQPAFAVGDAVRTRNLNPTGHTRLPRYARDKAGVIERLHGAHVFPDSNAHFQGEDPRHLYTVRFTAAELWGEGAPARDAVYIDLWEPYLERA
ncbi:MAG TPA: nitrile hydratase subunit beta [Caulobacteraceae bacterium]|nr:nitrile hydratase subunit beta [Caulobacteraceae bacterium]